MATSVQAIAGAIADEREGTMPATPAAPKDGETPFLFTPRLLRIAVRKCRAHYGDATDVEEIVEAARLITAERILHFRSDPDTGVATVTIDGHTARIERGGGSSCDCEDAWAPVCVHRWSAAVMSMVVMVAHETPSTLDRLADRQQRRRGRRRSL